VFNLTGSEIVVILLLALVILGPEKLPDAIRRFGRTYAELKKLGNGFQEEFRAAVDEPMREMRSTADMLRRSADFTDGHAIEPRRTRRARRCRGRRRPCRHDPPTEHLRVQGDSSQVSSVTRRRQIWSLPPGSPAGVPEGDIDGDVAATERRRDIRRHRVTDNGRRSTMILRRKKVPLATASPTTTPLPTTR
jgi:Tat protein translocase TatB subunit